MKQWYALSPKLKEDETKVKRSYKCEGLDYLKVLLHVLPEYTEIHLETRTMLLLSFAIF